MTDELENLSTRGKHVRTTPAIISRDLIIDLHQLQAPFALRTLSLLPQFRLCMLLSTVRTSLPKTQEAHFMQSELTETTHPVYQTGSSPSSTHSSHHGFRHSRPSSSGGVPQLRSRSSSRSVSAVGTATSDDFESDQLEERLRRLSHSSYRSNGQGRAAVAGQRIFDYENALTPSTPRQALGFKVIKRAQSPSEGVQLTDFPNGTSSSPR